MKAFTGSDFSYTTSHVRTLAKTKAGYAGFSLTAILVENKRIKGKPVQRHIAYLGIRKEKQMKSEFARRRDRATRGMFWRDATKRLDKLAIVERKKIEATIAQKIPRLTKQEFSTWQRERQAFGFPVLSSDDAGIGDKI